MRNTLALDDVVDIALIVFLEQGYDGTSMADLSAAAGITKSSLYHHVSSKEELLRLGIDRALSAQKAMLDEEEATDRTPSERLRTVTRRTCMLIVSLIPETAVLVRARGRTETEQWAIRERRLLDDRLAKLIAHSWADEGRSFDASAPAVAARLVFGMLSSVVDWYRPGHGPFDAELLAELADQILFDAALAGDARSRTV
jgi:AcrR family transcriptional regulator